MLAGSNVTARRPSARRGKTARTSFQRSVLSAQKWADRGADLDIVIPPPAFPPRPSLASLWECPSATRHRSPEVCTCDYFRNGRPVHPDRIARGPEA